MDFRNLFLRYWGDVYPKLCMWGLLEVTSGRCGLQKPSPEATGVMNPKVCMWGLLEVTPGRNGLQKTTSEILGRCVPQIMYVGSPGRLSLIHI